MITLNFDTLNPLEQKIHHTLREHRKRVDTIRIIEAAKVCNCSTSKISKLVKKLGFSSYKQYLDFLYGRETLKPIQTPELIRLQEFIQDFDQEKVDEMVKLMGAHDKLMLFGYGPSLLCAQYFEYRLKTYANKSTSVVLDTLSVASMADENTLLLIFTVTGAFKSFKDIYRETKQKGGNVAIIAEEYNPSIIEQCDRVIYLTNHAQLSNLLPHEKNRTLFFIFMEEVIQQLSKGQKAYNETT